MKYFFWSIANYIYCLTRLGQLYLSRSPIARPAPKGAIVAKILLLVTRIFTIIIMIIRTKYLSRSPIARPAPEGLPRLKVLLLLLLVVLAVVPVVVLLVCHLSNILYFILYLSHIYYLSYYEIISCLSLTGVLFARSD